MVDKYVKNNGLNSTPLMFEGLNEPKRPKGQQFCY